MPPFSILAGVIARGKIDVPVLKLIEHSGTDEEELDGVGLGGYLFAIMLANLAPVKILFAEEAITLVNNVPESVEVAVNIILVIRLIVTSA